MKASIVPRLGSDVLIALLAFVAVVAFALIAQDVAYYFAGYGPEHSRTARFVARHTRRRVLRVRCDRIRVTTGRAP